MRKKEEKINFEKKSKIEIEREKLKKILVEQMSEKNNRNKLFKETNNVMVEKFKNDIENLKNEKIQKEITMKMQKKMYIEDLELQIAEKNKRKKEILQKMSPQEFLQNKKELDNINLLTLIKNNNDSKQLSCSKPK